MDADEAIREAAVRHCRLLALRWGDAVPASEISAGFPYGYGIRLPLVPVWGRGITGPAQLKDGPLTLVSSLASAYEDEELGDEVLLYDYGPSPWFDKANAQLKELGKQGRHVILIRQVKPKPRSEYMVFAPVAVLDADDGARKFRLSLAPALSEEAAIPSPAPTPFAKAYAPTIVQARLHQAHFRRETLSAYRRRCCICDLDEGALLDAAHIVPDRLPEGMPTVNNGLCMCPTHHRAFDTSLLVVKPTYEIAIARERLQQAVPNEATARQLLAYDGRPIGLPRDERLRPDAALLQSKIDLAS
jgi:putative restriction endonuclease